MVVRKAIKMAKMYKANFYGLIENMAYAECPGCNQRIEVFGKPRGKEEARNNQIPFLGELPLDPQLAGFADQGMIEDYYSPKFDEIAKAITAQKAEAL
jgi:Mrp family chromosome partitioning ATPase